LTGALIRIGRDYFVDTVTFPAQIIALRGLPVEATA
jgi:hypothetical protein